MVGSTSERIPGYGPRVVLEWGKGTTSPGKGSYLVQYFTENTGHSLIIVDHDESTDRILTLEASDSLDGAGWGEIGPLREVENPGKNWKDKVKQTWESRIQSKKAVHIVRLGIDPRSIQGWLSQ